jgi:exodeoxyribonuclease VII small subunit
MAKAGSGKDKSAEEASFESLLAKLESSVGKLEDGELSLDESLALYVEAVATYRRCRGLLDGAQRRIEQVVKEAGGETAPFEVEDDSPDGD